MVLVRNPIDEEKKYIRELWEYSFGDEPDFVNYYFNEVYKKENTFALFEDDKMHAMLHLNPYSLIIGDEKFDCKYVVGVSVQPESRSFGYMSKLMSEVLNNQYKSRDIVSILMPIETKIYTKFGYTNCFNRYETTVDLNLLDIKDTLSEIKIVKDDEFDYISDMKYIYDLATKDIYCKLDRDREYFEKKIKDIAIDKGKIFISYTNNVPKAYMFAIPSGESWNVIELIFNDKESLFALMNMIKSHFTQYKKAKISTLSFDEFDLLYNSNNKFSREVKPFMMLRIINAKKVLESIINKLNIEEDFSIKVSDKYIPENNFSLYYDGKVNYVDKMSKYHIDLTISDLALLYSKFTEVKTLSIKNEISDISFFEKIFGDKKENNFINDYF